MKVKQEYEHTLKELAATMLEVARESVALVKRSDQAQSMKLNQKQEWEVYLEFLKVMFNLADRLSVYYIPIQAQPEFMDSLEDAVSQRLQTVLAPSLTSNQIDEMEITMSVGTAVSESRKAYERYKFVATEESKEKDIFFEIVGSTVAAKVGDPNNQAILSSAGLCARAVIPAMKALFEGAVPESAEPPPETESAPVNSPSSSTSSRPRIKLVSVMARVLGEEVETRWGVPPQFQKDLNKDEANNLAEHMNRVTQILGDRFAILTSSASEEHSQQSGQA